MAHGKHHHHHHHLYLSQHILSFSSSSHHDQYTLPELVLTTRSSISDLESKHILVGSLYSVDLGTRSSARRSVHRSEGSTICGSMGNILCSVPLMSLSLERGFSGSSGGLKSDGMGSLRPGGTTETGVTNVAVMTTTSGGDDDDKRRQAFPCTVREQQRRRVCVVHV